MEGGLVDGGTLERLMAVLRSDEAIVALLRLAGAADSQIAAQFGVEECEVARLLARARERVARRAPGSEVLLDVRARWEHGREAEGR